MRVAIKPMEGFVVRVTVPLKWFRLVSVTVAGLDCPGINGPNEVGTAMMPKSTTFALMIVKSENEGDLEDAVTVIVASPYATACTINVGVLLPPDLSMTVDQLSEGRTQLQPTWVAFRVTVPENVPTPATVMVDEPDEPEAISKVVGLADTLNPATATETVACLVTVPLLPNTVTV